MRAISATSRADILRTLRGKRCGASAAGAEAVLAAVEPLLKSYQFWSAQRAKDPALGQKVARAKKLQRKVEAVLSELGPITPTDGLPRGLREVAALLTGTTPQPIVDAVEQAHGALLVLGMWLARLDHIEVPLGARPRLPLDPLADALAAAWEQHIGQPTVSRDGPFEQVLNQILVAAGIADEDVYLYDLVRAAVKRRKNSSESE